MGKLPKNIFLYRITHIQNLPAILRAERLCCPNHPLADATYLGIGDPTLIEKRDFTGVPLQPGSSFRDYVAFYFGPRSPMLYQIWKGNEHVQQRPMQDIIYLVSHFDELARVGAEYLFSDGHAYTRISQFYQAPADLEKVDWQAVHARFWKDQALDPDLKRRKQAELLVYRELPLAAIRGIGVFDQPAKQKVENMLAETHIELSVEILPKLYYP